MPATYRQIAAQAAGNAELIFPPEEVVKRVEEQAKVLKSGTGPGVTRHWNALIRELDRHGTDYQACYLILARRYAAR